MSTELTARVCIVYPGSGDSLFLEQQVYQGLCESLAVSGGSVTVLGVDDRDGAVREQASRFRFEYEPLDQYPDQYRFARGVWGTGKTAYRVYAYLRSNDFTHVYCVDSRGLLFYCAIAKKLGLAFLELTLITLAVNPVARFYAASRPVGCSPAALGQAYMERRVAEYSDIVMGCDGMLSWMQEAGYQCDNQLEVRDLVLPIATQDFASGPSEQNFNRLIMVLSAVPFEVIKVALLGLSRNDVLAQSFGSLELLLLADAEKTELAAVQALLGEINIAHRVREVRRLEDLDMDQAGLPDLYVLYDIEQTHRGIASYLARNNRMFVFRNAQNRVTAQFANEFLDFPGDFARVVSAQQDELRPGWNAWSLDEIVEMPRPEATINEPADSAPLVSVCVVHHGRPMFLRRVLNSIAAQSYASIEVIIVDDGSQSEQVLTAFDEISAEFARPDWQFVKQENRWLGAARNHAASLANGKYLLFMDDDNISRVEMVATYVAAMEHGGQDILTCFAGVFTEDRCIEYGSKGPEIKNIFLPLGGATGIGLFYNLFGDAACMVRKEVFDILGGFWQHYGLPKEDQDFFLRAVDAGFRVEVVPEMLFYYRKSSDGMMASSTRNSAFERSVRLILSRLDMEGGGMSRAERQMVTMLTVRQWYERKVDVPACHPKHQARSYYLYSRIRSFLTDVLRKP